MKIDTDTSRKDPIKDPKIEFRTRKRPEKGFQNGHNCGGFVHGRAVCGQYSGD